MIGADNYWYVSLDGGKSWNSLGTKATGDPGADGKDGMDGKDGADGKNGTNGKDGMNGAGGRDGADGNDGRSLSASGALALFYRAATY